MEAEIADLNEQITKSVNEIAKEFELKYRDFMPNVLKLAECQEKIQQTIYKEDQHLKELEAELAEIEMAVVKAKSDSPQKKQEVIQEFLDRLKILSEMERCLDSFCTGIIDDPLANVRAITSLEELYKKLQSEAANNSEAVNDRILPLLFTEIQARKSELQQQLEEFYRKFLSFDDNDRVNPPVIIMTISYPSTKIATEAFSAMSRLGMFQERLEAFTDSVWEHFCSKIIYADESHEKILKINFSDEEHVTSFEIRREVDSTKKQKPSSVFNGLTQFFVGLQRALQGIRVDDRFLVDLFGESISGQLISALEKGCLNPAIPREKQKLATTLAELTELTSNFLAFMKGQGFFMQPVTGLFENFFASYERISIDRRCLHYVVTSRELVKKPYIELVEVGSAMDERVEENKAEIVQKMEDRFKVTPDDAELLTGTKWDKNHTKILQFQRCKISKSTFELMNLVQEVLQAAAEASSEMEACRLVTTAHNIVEMFAITSTQYHDKALTSVPQIAAVFFNNCHYICHRLMTAPADVMENIMEVSKITQQNCAFTEKFTELRTLAADKLELHIVNARRQLSATIGEQDIFNNLQNDKAFNRCKKTLNSCVLQIEQTANVWKEVMSVYLLAQSVGALVAHLLGLINEIVLRKEDITSPDATAMADLFESLVEKCKKIMTIDGKPMIQKLCDQPYYMLTEIIFCLKASLAEIGHRWCEGKGPLATWLNSVQVKQLIRAIFQNTDRRAQLLAQIN